ncbi:N-6 DNA methylase [Rhizobium sp. FY34]|uniref:N-6 DNA methylase n=1 Tax=Rhizobium sp. FY34 TaxID=2562309 RepID=UPI0010C0B10B|nr:N-6 DNA methylase [Rhizobium sp. FY34]
MSRPQDIVELLGFSLSDGKKSTWSKRYGRGGFCLEISEREDGGLVVDYGSIEQNRRTISDLSKPENRVVLECVDKLLMQGYAPECIVLEKSYPVGVGDKYLDILIKRDGKAFMMIECKAPGKDYGSAKFDLISRGGQLLSYWLQDRDALYLVLYTSEISGGKIEREYVSLETLGLSGSNLGETHASWDGHTFEAGIFEGAPYQPKQRRLRVSDLHDMASDDGKKVFNAFAEILRRHVISDKPNAFNKIFNLFICKIKDEEKSDKDAALDFQWLPEESPEEVLSRLNDLYRKGLKDYLKMVVTDHSVSEIESRLVTLQDDDKADIKRMFTELRLYKNNEFAFIEVYDRKTFQQNAAVVRDVVRLLQGKRLRYTHKQPFMGEFFERLLNTSVKQESGQFFTPIPVARFVMDSLPVEDIVRDKISSADPNFLPYILDYAAGSGHFLTEGMDRVDEVLKSTNEKELTNSQRANLRAWGENYLWAKEFVYGIEKDYRLAKTAKVSCFLNGDGEANLFRGDGLDNFQLSQEYHGILKVHSDQGGMDNQVFDIIAANPPYSVAQCRQTIKDGEKSFTLWPKLTEKSDDIECLFAERTKQLLKDGGVAGVIFPVSILSNIGIESGAREILLKYFDIVSIVVLGSMTFMKANVTTATLFLRRKPDDAWKAVQRLVDVMFKTFAEITINGIANPLTTYVQSVWGISTEEYVAIVRDGQSSSHKLYMAYRQAYTSSKGKTSAEADVSRASADFLKFVQDHEREKVLFFLLSYAQRTLLVNSPTTAAEQKRFLGYEFKERMGFEGLWPYEGKPNSSMLYDENDRSAEGKISTLIRRSFRKEQIEVPRELRSWAQTVRLSELLSFSAVDFENTISTAVAAKAKTGKWPVTTIGDLVTFCARGKSPSYATEKTSIAVLKSGQLKGMRSIDLSERHYLDPDFRVDPEKLLRRDDILVNSTGTGTAGRVTLYDRDEGKVTVDSHVTILRIDPSKALPEYVLYALWHYGFDKIERLAKGQSGQIELRQDAIKGIEIVLPSIEEQRRLIKRLNDLEQAVAIREQEALASITAKHDIVRAALRPATGREALHIGDVFTLNPSKSEIKAMGLDGDTAITFLPMAAVNTEGEITERTVRPLREVQKGYTYFRENDVLFAKITPCMENGKGALATQLQNGIGFGTTEFHVLRSKGDLDPVIIHNFIQTAAFRTEATPHMTGMGGQKRVPAKFVSDYRINVPSAEEQKVLLAQIAAHDSQVSVSRRKMKFLEEARRNFLDRQLG